MIAVPVFQECRYVAEVLPSSDWEGVCQICGQAGETVAVVGIWTHPEVPLVGGAMWKPGADHPFILVGPCGHSSLDQPGNVFEIRLADKEGQA